MEDKQTPREPSQPTGQPPQVAPTVQTNVVSPEISEVSAQKASPWRYVFITLGILQLLGVGLFYATLLWASQQARAGVSGTEFIGLILFVTLVPAVAFVAFVNIIGLSIYMLKTKPQGTGLGLGVLSLALSFILVTYAAYNLL